MELITLCTKSAAIDLDMNGSQHRNKVGLLTKLVYHHKNSAMSQILATLC